MSSTDKAFALRWIVGVLITFGPAVLGAVFAAIGAIKHNPTMIWWAVGLAVVYYVIVGGSVWFWLSHTHVY